MYKPQRRKDRAMDMEGTLDVLERGEYGVMASVDGENLPHSTPLSYIWYNGAIWFHCALVGQKIDNINHQSRVCFTVAGDVQAVYDHDFTTLYKSAVVYGDAALEEDEDIKREVLRLLCQKYLPDHLDSFEAALKGGLPRTAVYKIAPVHITGKHKKV